MPCNANSIASEIRGVLIWLAQCGLTIDQNFPRHTKENGVENVSYNAADQCSCLLRDGVDYRDAFTKILNARAYNFRLFDGSIFQISYAFVHGELAKQRLVYCPRPLLADYQDDLIDLEQSELYSETLARNAMIVPIRFDYDVSAPEDHPLSHLTLGQIEDCRIPVTRPLMPLQFVDFVLRIFYGKIWERYGSTIPTSDESFSLSIREEESKLTHLVIHQ